MIDIFTKDRNNRLTRFYPIDTSSGISEDRVNFKNVDEIPDNVHGKFVYFFAGYTPVWMYKTFSKNVLVIKSA